MAAPNYPESIDLTRAEHTVITIKIMLLFSLLTHLDGGESFLIASDHMAYSVFAAVPHSQILLWLDGDPDPRPCIRPQLLHCRGESSTGCFVLGEVGAGRAGTKDLQSKFNS